MAPKNEKGYYVYLKEELRQREAAVMPTSDAMVWSVIARFHFSSPLL